MPFLIDVRRRRFQPEVMDEPGLDAGAHALALRGLERINFLSRSAAILWPPIRALAERNGLRRLRVLDVASGAGDLPIRLWRRAQRTGLDLQIEGCDRSPEAIAYARKRASEQQVPVGFFECDALGSGPPAGYDVVTCSLFLHHLSEQDAVLLLRRLGMAAGHLLLINDLVRSALGFVLAYAGTRLLSRSSVVHVDGPRSVENAFTVEEARALAERAGLAGAVVVRRWPCRFLLSWPRP